MQAVQTIEDLTDNDGNLVWEVEEDGVRVDPIKKINKFQAAVERRTAGKNYKKTPGEYFYSRIRPPLGKDRHQTITEWRESQSEESA